MSRKEIMALLLVTLGIALTSITMANSALASSESPNFRVVKVFWGESDTSKVQVAPGDENCVLTVRLQYVEPSTTARVYHIKGTLSLPAGFETPSGESEAASYYGSVASGGTFDLQFTLNVKSTVSVTGHDAKLTLEGYGRMSPSIQELTVTIPVYGRVSFDVILPNPRVKPGINNLPVSLVNNGSADASNVELTVTTSSISMLQEDNRFYLGKVGSGSERQLNLSLYAPPSSSPYAGQLSFAVSYKDAYGVERSTSLITYVYVEAPPTPRLETSLQPDTIPPGRETLVTLYLENSGDYPLYSINTYLSFPQTSPLILLGADGHWLLEEIGPGESKAIQFKVYADPSSAGGTCKPTLTLSYRDQFNASYSETRYLGLKVQESEQGLVKLSLSRCELNPGQMNLVDLSIKNEGGPIEDLNLASSLSSAGSSSLILVGWDGFLHLNKLSSEETYNQSLLIYVSPSAAGNSYQLSFSLSYRDPSGVRRSEARLIGVKVSELERPKVECSLSPQRLTAGAVNNVALTISNKGSEPLSSVEVNVALPKSGSFVPLVLLNRDDKLFVGGLPAGESKTFDLALYAHPSASGSTQEVSLTLRYKDAAGAWVSETRALSLLLKGSVEVVASDYSSYPREVVPGSEFSLTVTLINLGTSPANGVNVTLAGGVFEPLTGGSTFVGDLPINTPTPFTLALKAPATLRPGSYQVSFEVHYRDDLHEKETLTISVPITVKESATGQAPGGAAAGRAPFGVGLVALSASLLAIALAVRGARASK